MAQVSFDQLPNHGRLWVFPVNRDLTEGEVARTVSEADAFLSGWAAHGMPLRAARELRDGRFLLVGVDVDAEAPSGCSIDALVNRLRTLGDDFGVSFIDHAPIWFRDGSTIRTVTRPEFRALAESGQVPADVAVFDTSLTRVEQSRDGSLERPATETWHGRAFFRDQAGV